MARRLQPIGSLRFGLEPHSGDRVCRHRELLATGHSPFDGHQHIHRHGYTTMDYLLQLQAHSSTKLHPSPSHPNRCRHHLLTLFVPQLKDCFDPVHGQKDLDWLLKFSKWGKWQTVRWMMLVAILSIGVIPSFVYTYYAPIVPIEEIVSHVAITRATAISISIPIPISFYRHLIFTPRYLRKVKTTALSEIHLDQRCLLTPSRMMVFTARFAVVGIVMCVLGVKVETTNLSSQHYSVLPPSQSPSLSLSLSPIPTFALSMQVKSSKADAFKMKKECGHIGRLGIIFLVTAFLFVGSPVSSVFVALGIEMMTVITQGLAIAWCYITIVK